MSAAPSWPWSMPRYREGIEHLPTVTLWIGAGIVRMLAPVCFPPLPRYRLIFPRNLVRRKTIPTKPRKPCVFERCFARGGGFVGGYRRTVLPRGRGRPVFSSYPVRHSDTSDTCPKTLCFSQGFPWRGASVGRKCRTGGEQRGRGITPAPFAFSARPRVTVRRPTRGTVVAPTVPVRSAREPFPRCRADGSSAQAAAAYPWGCRCLHPGPPSRGTGP